MQALRIGPSPVHGQGLFAVQPIAAGARVAEYFGEKISKSESLRRCQLENYFIFSLDDEWDIDGSVDWNLARFANHSCEPNCETDVIDGHIWIIALRDIAAGEEITYNYTYDYDDYKDHPCRCASPACVGYIVAEEFFPSVRQAKQYAKSAEAAANATP
jgi:SET domain-containing protein